MIVCRTEQPIPVEMKKKISLFCNVPPDCVISAQDVSTIYELPEALHSEGLDYRACELLGIWSPEPNLSAWREIVQVIKSPDLPTVRIAIVGKYVDLADSYKSLHEALTHGGIANRVRVELDYVDSETFEHNPDSVATRLGGAHAVLVPGGFGKRGIEGKIRAVRYARETSTPYLGICLGMQVAVLEFARHVAGLGGANSTEFEPECGFPVVDLMDEQRGVTSKGGTMRLGAYPCAIEPGSLAWDVYGSGTINERHRHRWEFNNQFREVLEASGMRLSGLSPDGKLVEMVELPNHPWFLGCQFHPEFKSRPLKPHPLFSAFIKAAATHASGAGKRRRDRSATQAEIAVN
ncbi:MAG: CTP synthase, partial [Myxococcales bacterium]|nr:CTP synthase [Myxococcales bacterium]